MEYGGYWYSMLRQVNTFSVRQNNERKPLNHDVKKFIVDCFSLFSSKQWNFQNSDTLSTKRKRTNDISLFRKKKGTHTQIQIISLLP